MAQCGSLTYTVKRTDQSNPEILVPKGSVNNDFGISILGKRRREYGQEFNENMLRLLENFACPSVDSSAPIDEQFPDVSQSTVSQAFNNPVVGQMWYNKSNNRLYYWGLSGASFRWVPLQQQGDVAGNSGFLMHGEAIPLPVNPHTGYQFQYSECSWNVSPALYPDDIDFMSCQTVVDNGTVRVRMLYRVRGSGETTEGIANFQIIGIKGNDGEGEIITPIPTAAPTTTPPPTTTTPPPPTTTPAPTTTTPPPTTTTTPAPTTTAPPPPFNGVWAIISSEISGGCNGSNEQPSIEGNACSIEGELTNQFEISGTDCFFVEYICADAGATTPPPPTTTPPPPTTTTPPPTTSGPGTTAEP